MKTLSFSFLIVFTLALGPPALAGDENPVPANPFQDGNTKVVLSPEDHDELLEWANTAKSKLETALQEARGKTFAETNRIFLDAVKASVIRSVNLHPRAELLMRKCLNDAMKLTYGIPTRDGMSWEESGLLWDGTPNRLDLMTVILEDPAVRRNPDYTEFAIFNVAASN